MDLERLELLADHGGSTFGLERCRRCDCLYRSRQYDLNDWGDSGDYCDTTHIWVPVAPVELDKVRADTNYAPQAPVAHRHDSGWRSQ